MTKEEFCKEELRSNYLVSSDMKKIWWVELELLKEFIRVCNKHNLKYYAEGGTLIGIIRHRGFIPWDDDIDITMPRNYYDKLQKIAADEFKHPFFFQTPYTDKYSSRFFAILRNSNTTGISSNDNQNQNKGIGIDIFPLDGIPDDEKLFCKQKRKMKIFDKIIGNHFKFYQRKEPQSPIKYIMHFFANIIFYFVSYNVLYKQLEKTLSMYSSSSCQRIGLISYSPYESKLYYKREWYSSTTLMPFEDIELPVPVGYDALLRTQYGDYMIEVQDPSDHNKFTFIYDTEKPYTYYTNQKEQ